MDRYGIIALVMLMGPGYLLAQGPPFAPSTGPAATLEPPAEGFAGPVPPSAPRSPAEAALTQGPLFGVELSLIRPHLGGAIAGGPLDTTVAPTFLLGYRFRSGRSLHFEYRYFGSPRDEVFHFAGDPAPVSLHRHVEGHIFDFDVRFLQGGFAVLQSQWEIGARAANLSIYSFRPSTNFPSLVSNRFQGVGPHFDYKVSLTVFDTGLELFGRSDIGLLFGNNRGFSQVPDLPYGSTRRDWPHNSNSAFTWTGRWQLGASYWFNWRASQFRIAGGYEVDAYYFFSAGERQASGGGSWSLFPFRYEPGNIRLVNKGPFLRVEFKY